MNDMAARDGREMPGAPGPRHIVEHLFRHEAGKLVAVLSRIFGIDNIDLAEDVVQDVLLKALERWGYGELPENPSAWMMQVAKHRALDILRREKSFRQKEPEVMALFERELAGDSSEIFLPSEVEDDQLRMIFVCCHPALSAESQIAITLKTLCGFSVTEIAQAFLTSESTIAKRITRARGKARELAIPYEIPGEGELRERLDSVLNVLYLLFNEGHSASGGDALIRLDLCAEAIRLARLLSRHPVGDTPKTSALLALMLFHAARLPARLDDHGELLLLSEQDRSLWSGEMIADAVDALARSARGESISEYHLQAGIAACHTLAPSYEATDWRQILSYYDLLSSMNASPVIALNRSVAVMMLEGPAAGIAAVDAIEGIDSLDGYYLLHAILADFHLRLGDHPAARERYSRALSLARSANIRSFIIGRLSLLDDL